METKILKVVRQGEAFSVQSSKQESGSTSCCANWVVSSKTSMCAPCWAIWRRAGSTKVMW